MTKQTLGQRMVEKRRSRNMTQEALAEQLNVTPQAVSKWRTTCPARMCCCRWTPGTGRTWSCGRTDYGIKNMEKRLHPAWKQPLLVVKEVIRPFELFAVGRLEIEG